MAGDRAEDEPEESRKATVLTKFWKEWDKDGNCRILACSAVRGAVIRGKWDTKLRLYPFAAFRWERRRNCAYGESEVTYLIPNQIAINRTLTANVWAVMMLGMPLTVVNTDVVQQRLTNDPGQILEVSGTAEELAGAVRYVNPPNFSPAFDNNIASLISNTLTQSGANDAALGDIRPDNTSAIVAVREAATMPMQTVQNRFYSFVEDIARIWADMWVTFYGKRSLKIEDENGVWYLPFDGEKLKDLLIAVKDRRGGLHSLERDPERQDAGQPARRADYHAQAVPGAAAQGLGAQSQRPYPGTAAGAGGAGGHGRAAGAGRGKRAAGVRRGCARPL